MLAASHPQLCDPAADCSGVEVQAGSNRTGRFGGERNSSPWMRGSSAAGSRRNPGRRSSIAFSSTASPAGPGACPGTCALCRRTRCADCPPGRCRRCPGRSIARGRGFPRRARPRRGEARTATGPPGRNNGAMSSPLAGVPEELAGRQAGHGASSLVLPNGPRYPRVVQAWLWLKKPTWFLDRCSRAYGDVFTMRLPLGINMVHIAGPELVKAVFGGDNDVLRAGEANAAIREPMVGPHSVLVLDGPERLRQRKLILPAFHGDRMRAWEASVREITRAEIARWPVGQPFALRPSMQSITLDVIVRVVFGVDGSARGNELRRRILTLTAIGRNPFLHFATRDRKLGPNAPWARFIRARDALYAALTEEIRQRRHAPDLDQRGDVLSQLLLARDDEGRAMTDDEVRDELVTLLFAGHETTATALAWAFDLLLHDPGALGRLVAELDGGGSEYLDAPITKTLRVRPAIAVRA